MAEAVLKDMLHRNEYQHLNWTVDSAGVANWNVGRPPEPRCLQVLNENELTSNHIGRQVMRHPKCICNYS